MERDEVGDAVDDDARFAAARAREHEQRPFDVSHGLALRVVELGWHRSSSLTLRPRPHKTRANPVDLLYALAMRALRLRSVLAGVSVRLPHAPGLTLLPEECACCGQAVTHHAALPRKGGTSLLVGYCDDCADHQASASSRVLALSLASVLLALSGAAGVPLLAPKLGLYALMAVVTLLSLVPLLVLLMPTRRMHPEHAARGAAVLWSAEHTLWCARAGYAERVLELNGGELGEELLNAPRGSAWLSAGPVTVFKTVAFNRSATPPGSGRTKSTGMGRMLRLEAPRVVDVGARAGTAAQRVSGRRGGSRLAGRGRGGRVAEGICLLSEYQG